MDLIDVSASDSITRESVNCSAKIAQKLGVSCGLAFAQVQVAFDLRKARAEIFVVVHGTRNEIPDVRKKGLHPLRHDVTICLAMLPSISPQEACRGRRC